MIDPAPFDVLPDKGAGFRAKKPMKEALSFPVPAWVFVLFEILHRISELFQSLPVQVAQ